MKSRYEKNCLWLEPLEEAEEQMISFLKSNLNFAALEFKPFSDRMPLPGEVVYVLNIRYPLDRIVSEHSHYMTEDYPSHMTLAEYITKGPIALTRNYYMKMLGCCSKDPCTRADLEKAKKMLDYFSAILVTDNLDTFKQSSYLLKTRLGWNITDVSIYANFLR